MCAGAGLGPLPLRRLRASEPASPRTTRCLSSEPLPQSLRRGSLKRGSLKRGSLRASASEPLPQSLSGGEPEANRRRLSAQRPWSKATQRGHAWPHATRSPGQARPTRSADGAARPFQALVFDLAPSRCTGRPPARPAEAPPAPGRSSCRRRRRCASARRSSPWPASARRCATPGTATRRRTRRRTCVWWCGGGGASGRWPEVVSWLRWWRCTTVVVRDALL